MNNLLAEWAARSATTSAALIDRLEAMGYAVRGKSEDEIADVLHQPPTGRPQTSSR
ncbi:DNA-binding MarR family transcriptional regulator [Methylobacterium sp. PvR107]|nr:DNA-binding MarR family transcriptional regulator [Methylobacterium sp. PvR107]